MQRDGRKVQDGGRTPGTDHIHRLKFPKLALIATVAVLAMLPSALLRVETAQAAGALTIVVPVPNQSGTSTGPVGTNVTISGTGFTASEILQIGAATLASTCTAGFQALSSQSVTADASGSFTTTFAWPSTLVDATGYYICAQDTATTPATLVQSTGTFLVAGPTPPAITSTRPVPGPTPGAGTPAIPANGYYPGSTVEIDGSNFLPQSTALQAYLTTSQITKPSDLSSAVPLTPVGGQQIASGAGGQVTATVQIPSTQPAGAYYIYLASTDGQAAGVLPSLIASSSQITVVVVPPQPSPTATPGATPSPTGNGNGNNTNELGAGQLVAVVGLGGLSVVLFIVGVMLLASAAALPRQG
jgi:hypothetical protein